MPAPDAPETPLERRLILVRHAAPQVDPAVPAREWHLSAEGRLACLRLAELLAAHRPQALFSSLEPKALETAAILGERLSLPVEPVPGLHEHERRSVAFSSKTEFEATIAQLFASPEEVVFGDESASQACQRFELALAPLLLRPFRSQAVVSHGTIISLFVDRRCRLDPYALWKRLGMPALIAVSLPDFEILDLLEQVDQDV